MALTTLTGPSSPQPMAASQKTEVRILTGCYVDNVHYKKGDIAAVGKNDRLTLVGLGRAEVVEKKETAPAPVEQEKPKRGRPPKKTEDKG